MPGDNETKEGAGGWEVPTSAANDELVEAFRDNHVTFRSHSSGFTVYLDGDENLDVVKSAAKRGYEVRNVRPIDGPFNIELTLGTKVNVRQVNDAKEHQHRVNDE